MIMQGISYDKILDRVRETSAGKRTCLLEKQDIRNIAEQGGLDKTHRMHKEDAASVRLIIQEMSTKNEVLLFEDQVEGNSKDEFVFCFSTLDQQQYVESNLIEGSKYLICMDSTHGISHYEGWQLTTLMVISNLNKGFPIAFMVSSTVNTAIVTKFLQSFKNRYGNINAEIFMSDDDSIYRNSWKTVMETENCPTQYLLCSWHVDRAIRENMRKKLKASMQDKVNVYRLFRVLLDEPVKENFELKLKNFLKYLEEAGYDDFRVYLQKYYLCDSRKQLWAKCFRPAASLNTNNHLESMHRTLKYVFLDGKKVKRLDDTLYAIRKMVKVLLHRRLIDLTRKRFATPDMLKKHMIGKELEVIQVEQGCYEVDSGTYHDKSYTVLVSQLSCSDCQIRCPECRVCICMFSCNCEDNSNGTRFICKHIHAVNHKMEGKIYPAPPKSSTEEIANLSEHMNKIESPLEQVKNELYDAIEILLSKIEKNTSDDNLDGLKTATTLVKKASGALDTISKIPSSKAFAVDARTAKEPINTKLVRQDRFRSTKKRKSESTERSDIRNFKKPSNAMREELNRLLLAPTMTGEVLLVSEGLVGQEHDY